MKLWYIYGIDWAVEGRSRVKRDECAEALGLPYRLFVYADEDAIASILRQRYGWGVRGIASVEEWNDSKIFKAD